MASLRASIVLATVLAAIPATPLLGQTPDSAVFHRRQWGVDFNIGGGFVGAGLIHFSSPTHALVLALSGNVTTTTSTALGGTENNWQVNLSLGVRRYHSFAPNLNIYRTVGVEGFYGHEFSGGPTANTWRGGLFGELGAGWLVTPHLAVGAAWQLSADYWHSKNTAGPNSSTTHEISLTLGTVQLRGQVYF